MSHACRMHPPGIKNTGPCLPVSFGNRLHQACPLPACYPAICRHQDHPRAAQGCACKSAAHLQRDAGRAAGSAPLRATRAHLAQAGVLCGLLPRHHPGAHWRPCAPARFGLCPCSHLARRPPGAHAYAHCAVSEAPTLCCLRSAGTAGVVTSCSPDFVPAVAASMSCKLLLSPCHANYCCLHAPQAVAVSMPCTLFLSPCPAHCCCHHALHTVAACAQKQHQFHPYRM